MMDEGFKMNEIGSEDYEDEKDRKGLALDLKNLRLLYSEITHMITTNLQF